MTDSEKRLDHLVRNIKDGDLEKNFHMHDAEKVKPRFTTFESIIELLPNPNHSRGRIKTHYKLQNMHGIYEGVRIASARMVADCVEDLYKHYDGTKIYNKKDILDTGRALKKLNTIDTCIVNVIHFAEDDRKYTMKAYEAMFSHFIPQWSDITNIINYKSLFKDKLELKCGSWGDVGINKDYLQDLAEHIHNARYRLFVTNYPVLDYSKVGLRELLIISTLVAKIIAVKNYLDIKK